MLECAGPWTSPWPARSSTYSSNVLISRVWVNIEVSSLGSAPCQSFLVAVTSVQGDAGASFRCVGMSTLLCDSVSTVAVNGSIANTSLPERYVQISGISIDYGTWGGAM